MDASLPCPANLSGLRVLRERIARAAVPSSCLDETLSIATWNIRAFGKAARSQQALRYIAEILGCFDLIAIVELGADIEQLRYVLSLLGPYWEVIFSDYVTDAGGNSERIGFIYDKRAVRPTGLVGHVQSPRRKVGDEYVSELSWWRPPYIASFHAGKFDFVLLAAHIRWGQSAGTRVGELQLLAEWVAKRLTGPRVYDHDIIVVGDFNIPSTESPLYTAVTAHGLQLPAALVGKHGSNLARDKRYDQILHLPKYTKSFTNHGGVLDFYDGDHHALFPDRPTMTKTQFTYELSDHLPLWCQLGIGVEEA
jgi:endonuclease/exonuclease/phosphatase family metal-dependent hydrolase